MKGRLPWVLGGAALFVAGTIAGVLLTRSARNPSTQLAAPDFRFTIVEPLGTQFSSSGGSLAVSPDGSAIVYIARDEGGEDHMWLRPLDDVAAHVLPGTEGASQPFWSADGRSVAFFSHDHLNAIDVFNGSVRSICRSPAVNSVAGTWNHSGDIIFGAIRSGLFHVISSGGMARPVVVPGCSTCAIWPQFLPDGRHYLYLSITARPEDQGIYVGSLETDLRKRIVASEYAAAFSPPGSLLFVKDDALMAQPFDATALELSGEPVPVLEQLALFKIAQPAPRAIYAVSTNGVLAWRPRSTRIVEPKQLTWYDRSGVRLGTLGVPAVYFAPALSPDEKSVAVCRMDPVANSNDRRDLWIFDVERGTSRRLTFDPADDCGPAWSPDGRRIAFFSDRRGTREIYVKAANGSGDEELLLAAKDQESRDPLGMSSEDWSADGRFLVYNAAIGTVSPFLEISKANMQAMLDVNCRGPLFHPHQS